MPAKRTGWVNGLDSIRFVLAAIVMLSHLHDPFVDLFKGYHSMVGYAAGVLLNHFFCGTAAVTAFFIISGFVIHYPHRHMEAIEVVPFLVRRWLRVGIPLVVFSLVATHYHLFNTLPLWSLYCELIYYTIYPVLFKIKISWQRQLYGAYAISAIFILLFIVDSHHRIVPHRIFFTGERWYVAMAIINLPCWMLGVLLAGKADDMNSNITPGRLWAYRVMVFGLSTLFVALKMQWHVNYAYSMVVFALLLYKWLQQEVIYHREHTASPAMEYLGKFSYSLYLCHMLAFALIGHFFADTVYTWAAYVGLAIVLSYLAYLLVEYPSHRAAQWLSIALTKNK